LTNVVDVADLAFSLSEAVDLPAVISADVDAAGKDFIVVMPSAVVRGIFEATGGNYVAAVASLIGQIRARTQKGVVIAPHSYRAGLPEGRMNDGPVCREVAAACASDPMVVSLDADLTAGELRRLVSMGSVLVTSRFHAMISGLSTATPTVVVGWSHKYKEVLDDFGLADFGMDSTVLSHPEKVADVVVDALSRKNEISEQISRSLPSVRERSMKNFVLIASAVRA
jgi:polysaccharide pyruvyl transferase WcaK-like protein